MAYTDTPNIPLHMPTPGTREPAQIALLNENCVTLSNHDHTTGKALAVGRMRSGLAANRPAAGQAGNVYFSTDTGIFNVDTGTAWVQFLTSGGQATVTGWTLIDPVVRDTIQWGPEGSGTIDATLTRTAAQTLDLGGASAKFSFATDMYFARTLATDPNVDGVGLRVQAPGLAINSQMRAWHFSSYTPIQFAGGASVVGNATTPGLYLQSNSYVHTPDVNNIAMDGNSGSMSLTIGTTIFSWSTAPAPLAGSGGALIYAQRMSLDEPGTLTISPKNVGLALNAVGTVRVQGNYVHIGPAANNPGNGGHVRLSDDTGAQRWLMGLLTPAGSKEFVIYDLVRAAQVFTIATSTGALTLQPINQSTAAITAMGNVIAQAENTGVPIRIGSAYSRAGLYSGSYMDMTAEGAITVKAISGGVNLSAGAGASVTFVSSSTYIHPLSDGAIYNGHPSYRWQSIYLVSAPVVGSSADLKEDISPLDPAACVASVLETDWVNYTYKAPPFVTPETSPANAHDEHDNNETKAEKKARRDADEDAARKAHAKSVVETAPHRRQKGYVLNSPDHKVGAEFGLPDGMNRSDGADIAVVACALQDALRRLAALEARDGNAAAA